MKNSFNRAARLEKPRALLPGLLETPSGIWLDAGCGDGVFADVLRESNPAELCVIGLDRDRYSLRRFSNCLDSKQQPALAVLGDLESELPFTGLDGILLANVLHYFAHPEQVNILRRVARAMNHSGMLVIVEYNSNQSTSAVPHPIPLSSVSQLLKDASFIAPQKISRVSSSYLREMYAVRTQRLHGFGEAQ